MSFAPGLYPHMSREQYVAIRAENYSTLKEAHKSLRQYRHSRRNPKAATDPMRLGTASHVATLEPHRLTTDFAVWDLRTESGKLRPRQGKDWEAFAEANAARTILLPKQYAAAVAVRDATRANPDAAALLESGQPEVSMVWVDADTGRLCKGRLDWLTIDPDTGRDVVVGLKTARDCRPIPFGNACYKLLYHLQWGMYSDGFKAVTGREPLMIEIVVEPTAPYDSAVYEVQDDILDLGRDEYVQHLRKVIECERDNTWPGAAPGRNILSFPSRAYESADDLSDLGLEFDNGSDDGTDEEAS